MIGLLAAFRHARALPAELRANWIFHQCWPGRLREYLTGVERAAVVAVAAPAVAALLPVHLVFLGVGAAFFHAVSGMLMAVILLVLSMYDAAVPPFVSSYARRGNVKSLGPIFVMIVLTFAFSVAAIERASATTMGGMFLHTLILVAILAAVRTAASRRRRSVAPLTADIPEPTLQSLGLSG